MSDLVCKDCGETFVHDKVVTRRTKRFCDGCLRKHRLDRQGRYKGRHSKGECPDCGAHSSMRGRRCDPCGRAFAGKSKTRGAEARHESQRRTALVLLRAWGRDHGGVGPTMARWDECDYFELPALRVLRAFNGWLAALDAAGLEHPTHARSPRGRHERFNKNRRMVTAGEYDLKPESSDPAAHEGLDATQGGAQRRRRPGRARIPHRGNLA